MESVLNQPKKNIIIRIILNIPFHVVCFVSYIIIFIQELGPKLKKIYIAAYRPLGYIGKEVEKIPSATFKSNQSRAAILYSLNIKNERKFKNNEKFEFAFLNKQDNLRATLLGQNFKINNSVELLSFRTDKLGEIPFLLAKRFETEKLLKKLAQDYEDDADNPNNFKNLVIIEPGFESILHQFKDLLQNSVDNGLRIFEVDTVVKQKVKLHKIDENKDNYDWNSNVRYCSFDFEDYEEGEHELDFIDKMMIHHLFMPSLRTLYIWTGSACYLERWIVLKLLYKIRTASKSVKSQVLFDCLDDFDKDKYIPKEILKKFKIIKEDMAKEREVDNKELIWKWGIHSMDKFANRMNFKMIKYMNSADLTDEYFTTKKGQVNMTSFKMGHLSLLEVA